MLMIGTFAASAIARMYLLPSLSTRSWRMQMPWPIEARILPVSAGVSPWLICVASASRKWAWPPSCVMPASKALRVRVDLSKNSRNAV